MRIKKGLLITLSALLIFMLITSVTALGNDADSIEIPGIHFFQEYHYEKGSRGESLFLFSSSYYSGSHTGNVILFKSNLDLSGSFKGNIYSLFSTVTIDSSAEIIGHVYTVSSIVNKDVRAKASVNSLLIFAENFRQVTGDRGVVIYNDQLSTLFIYFIVGLSRVLVCLIILGLKSAFFEQGSVLLVYEPLSTIQNGIISYFILLALGLIFLFSVVGVVITALIFLFSFGAVLIGQTSLNILIGYFITDKCKISTGTYANTIIGGIIIEVISFIPYLRLVINFLFIPILCLGILITNIINGFLKKKFYDLPFGQKDPIPLGPNDEIRKIIINSLK